MSGRRADLSTHDAGPELTRLLRAAVRGPVDDSSRRRAEYSSDASNYRVLPRVVVEPLDRNDVLATLEIGRSTGTPVTNRGGGTSIAGNAIGPGIVIDFSRHLNRILHLDPVGRTAVVEPGVILADLQRRTAPHQLRFGPDPSSHARATLGGMIGNNACGTHAVAYGRTADNVEALTAIDGTGRRFTTDSGLSAVPGLEALVNSHLGILRTEFGTFARQVSGYSLEHLLPERGRRLAAALVGSEGTLATTLEATLRLHPISPARLLVVLGYPDMATTADAVPTVLQHRPLAVEGLDARLVSMVRSRHGTVPDLPMGGGWLMCEIGGETTLEATTSAAALVRDAAAQDSLIYPAGPAATALWRIREDGAGLAGRTPDGRPAWPGWEDAAVPPANLGRYLREFEELLAENRLTGIPYGHFGDGCVHIRLDLPLDRDTDLFQRFMFDAARLVVAHGGSPSGEHGDGRARSELLPLKYSPTALTLFRGVKALFDPQHLLNPGILVDPVPIDVDLRRPQAMLLPAIGSGFAFGQDAGDLTTAVHRCVGVGKCRADNRESGGFMCPSFQVTRDEKDSTRGRARVLQELAIGALPGAFASTEVHESLDLCLSCKACASDCPAEVDMARYKSEVLHRRYRRRIRPIAHYTLGRLPTWISLLDKAPRFVTTVLNRALATGRLSRMLLAAAGIDRRRSAPPFATVSFRRSAPRPSGTGTPVVLWADTFTNGMAPAVAEAAAAVLRSAGYQVILPERSACCGLTWISTGQLDGARRRLLGLLDVLGPYAAQGIPIVGLEPSCTAVLRTDLVDLLPADPRASAVADATCTLAELIGRTPDWTPPDLSGLTLLVQPHCHQHAITGFAADRALLAEAGATVTELAGCCGMAGNFGMEKGHYDMSVAVAELSLLPAIRGRSPETLVLADGFSCRTQIDQLTGVTSTTLPQLLAARAGTG